MPLRILTLDESFRRSFENCHVRGVDSIVLAENVDTGELVRVFWANPGHELYHNHDIESPDLRVALHPHHCDIRITPIFGDLMNIVVTPGFDMFVNTWEYVSGIANSRGYFRQLPEQEGFGSIHRDVLTSPCDMTHDQVHTVFVPKGQTAAWLVEEGPTNGRANPRLCYSNSDLTKFKFGDHYTPLRDHDKVRMLMDWYKNDR